MAENTPVGGTMERRKQYFIVILDGADKGGKSSVKPRLQKELGARMVYLPEVASMLGGPQHDENDPDQAWDFQRRVYNVCKHLLSLVIENASPHVDTIVLDRSGLTGAAYTPGGRDVFVNEMETTIEDELGLGDLVIIFEPASTSEGDVDLEGNATRRQRSTNENAELHARTIAVYDGHGAVVQQPYRENFDEKATEVIETVRAALEAWEK